MQCALSGRNIQSDGIIASDTEIISTENSFEDKNKITLKMPCENYNDKAELEIIDYVVIPDTELANHTEYKAEFFKDNEIPSLDDSKKTKYVFFKCKWKNTSEHEVYSDLDFNLFISAKDFPYLGLCTMFCYFDSPENTNGEKRDNQFFWHHLKSEEELECIVGMACVEDEELRKYSDEDKTYYVGHQPVNVDYFTLENTKGYIYPLADLGDGND